MSSGMRLLLSHHIYEFVKALMPTGIEIYAPDNAQRQKLPKAANVHEVPQEVTTDCAAAAAYLAQHRINVVYAQGRGAMAFYAKVRKMLRGQHSFRLVVTVHTGYVWCVWWKSLVFILLARLQSDGLVFLAEALRRKYGWVAALLGLKTWVVRNPVDLSRFPLEHDYARINKEELHLGSIGVLTPIKGHEMLIEAVRILRERGLRLHLTVVGDINVGEEWYYEKLKTLIGVFGLSEMVTILPGMSYDDIPRFLSTLDCYVCSSRIEVLPFSILEAMASGLPIISTRVGGTEDLVNDGENGYLCRKENAAEMANCIARVVESGRLVAFGKESRRRAESEFSNACFVKTMGHILTDGGDDVSSFGCCEEVDGCLSGDDVKEEEAQNGS
jgi:glycosyltransferase involved in cell wall biosynthesis